MDSALRSRAALLLIGAALLISLLLGSAFVVLHRLRDPDGAAADTSGSPLSDSEARRQVLDPARLFVADGRLRAVTGSYLLQSCGDGNEPPYRGVVYLNFDVPTVAETPAYFRGIARAMRDHGWVEGIAPNSHPGGKTLSRDGLSARYHRNPDVPGRGVLQIYGQCRNVTDHRPDAAGFVNITDELSG